jgi:hypothetical protein
MDKVQKLSSPEYHKCKQHRIKNRESETDIHYKTSQISFNQFIQIPKLLPQDDVFFSLEITTHTFLWFQFSQQWLWRVLTSGIWCCVLRSWVMYQENIMLSQSWPNTSQASNQLVWSTCWLLIAWLALWLWRWRQYTSPKCQSTDELHDIISQSSWDFRLFFCPVPSSNSPGNICPGT